SATKQVVQGSSFNAWFFALPVLKGILEHLAREGVRSVILASFSSQVLNLKLDPPGGMQITDVFLGALRGERTIPSRVAPPSASGGEWTFGHVASFDDARKACLLALLQNACTSAKTAGWFTNMRRMMWELDARFKGNRFETNTERMMHVLVSRLEAEGLVATDPTVKPKNSLVWLTAKGIEVATGLAREPAGDTATQTTAAVAEEKNQKPSGAPTTAATANAPVEPQVVSSEPPRATHTRPSPKGTKRSRQSEHALRGIDLGPFATYLDPMLSALRELPLDEPLK